MIMYKPRAFKANIGQRGLITVDGQVMTAAEFERAGREAWRQALSQMPSMPPSWIEPSASSYLPKYVLDEIADAFRN
jgi:hypothetical protein